MYKIGRTIFADKETGRVLHNTGEITTTDSDYEKKVDYYKTVKELAERVRDSVIEVKLETGQYEHDFREGFLDRVDPETKELFFYYPDPNMPEEPPVSVPPLTEQVAQLKAADLDNKEAIASLFEMVLMGSEVPTNG